MYRTPWQARMASTHDKHASAVYEENEEKKQVDRGQSSVAYCITRISR